MRINWKGIKSTGNMRVSNHQSREERNQSIKPNAIIKLNWFKRGTWSVCSSTGCGCPGKSFLSEVPDLK